jgi:hypothetical protein
MQQAYSLLCTSLCRAANASLTHVAGASESAQHTGTLSRGRGEGKGEDTEERAGDGEGAEQKPEATALPWRSSEDWDR